MGLLEANAGDEYSKLTEMERIAEERGIQPVYDEELNRYRTPTKEEISLQLEEATDKPLAKAKKKANEFLLRGKAFHIIVADNRGDLHMLQYTETLNPLELKGFLAGLSDLTMQSLNPRIGYDEDFEEV